MGTLSSCFCVQYIYVITAVIKQVAHSALSSVLVPLSALSSVRGMSTHIYLLRVKLFIVLFDHVLCVDTLLYRFNVLCLALTIRYLLL